MKRDYRKEAETAQLSGILGILVDQRTHNQRSVGCNGECSPKLALHSSRKKMGAIDKKVENIYSLMLDCLARQESKPQSADRVVLRAKTTSNTTRRRSKEALARRREKYFSRKVKGQDTVTVLIEGGS